ncbi:MAG: hypothetical protein ACR2I5_09005 [Candidatus Limnocylindria bacterium]
MAPSRAAAIGAVVTSLVVVVLPLPVVLRAIATLTVALLLGDAVGRAIVPTRLGVGGRLALSLTIALALPVAMALVLTASPIGIGRVQLVAAALLVGGVASTITVRRSAPIGPTFTPLRAPRRLARPAILYLVAVIIVGTAFALRLAAPVPGDAPYSSLSITPGSPGDGRIAVEVVNREGTTVLYRLQLELDGRLIGSETSAVPDGGRWEYTPHTFVAPGEHVEVQLFRSPDLKTLYRDVNATVGPGW